MKACTAAIILALCGLALTVPIKDSQNTKRQGTIDDIAGANLFSSITSGGQSNAGSSSGLENLISPGANPSSGIATDEDGDPDHDGHGHDDEEEDEE